MAISADNRSWFLLGASPDLRAQIEANAELHPCESNPHDGVRQSPIGGAVLANADIDHVLGLLLMRGLTPASDWTHLIPGFICAGAGTGLINPPLASTAIGVVRPERAGMASGVNSTFRQIGIAAGIAALGSIFNSALQHNLSSAPAVASAAPRLATMIRQGQVGQLLASLPPARRGVVAEAIRSAFAAGLNDLLIVTAALAFAGAVCALLLIRSRDFVRTGRTEPPGASPAAAGTGAGATSQARSA